MGTTNQYRNGANRPESSSRPVHTRQAFTLIEVLVVVAIIALLIGILAPSLKGARGHARRVACLSNLHSIHLASVAYANNFGDHFPDFDTLGNYGYRRAPGLKSGTGPMALPEKYGLQAILEKTKNIAAKNSVWLCPDAAEWLVPYRNTYAFSTAPIIQQKSWSSLMTRNSSGKSLWQTWWVWDNYNQIPGDAGSRGPFGPGYTLAVTDQRVNYPHSYSALPGQAITMSVNVSYLDGHAAPHYKQQQ
jgi:prepilin-type N-terminal cleavage/methylation domain-containing protein/prepilin-type processing-associated H-X9-DG protein